MFRRLFAIETAAIRNDIEHAADRYDSPTLPQIDSFRDPARPMAMPAYYGAAALR